MTSELLAKIHRILKTREPSESDVHHLFSLSRKLIEQLPPDSKKKNFALLAFYSDWTVHSKIDRSFEGAMLIERMNAIINDHMKRDDSSAIPGDLTAALSFDETKIQLSNLIREFDPDTTLSIDRIYWRPIVIQLIEIISDCPLKIDSTHKRLKSVRERIAAKPIKGRTVIEKVAIVKVPGRVFYPKAEQDDLISCIELTLSNTTRIVAPLIIS